LRGNGKIRYLWQCRSKERPVAQEKVYQKERNVIRRKMFVLCVCVFLYNEMRRAGGKGCDDARTAGLVVVIAEEPFALLLKSTKYINIGMEE